MSIEEKAKAYDEALEKARQLCAYPTTNPFISDLQDLFPELKESEDEKIRKELIEYIKTGTYHKDWIAWLEKQVHVDEDEIVKGIRRGVAISLINHIDANSKGMCLSNMECEDIENAVVNEDWDKVYGYMKKKLEKQGEKIIPLKEIILNVWELGNYWKDLTKGFCNTEYGSQLDYIVKHWKEGEHYIKSFEKQGEQNIDPDTLIQQRVDALADIVAEQKPTDKVEPKFHEGDWVVLSTSDGEKVVQIDSIEYFESGEPRYITSTGKWFGNGTEAHLWTIQDAKDGDVLLFEGNYNSIALFQGIGINGEGRINYHCKCDLGDYSFCVQGDVACLGTIEKDAKHYHPATKEQRDLLFAKMKEAGYEWDAEKKELKEIEQKPTNLAKGEDYGIDGLYNAIRILEKTLGKVDGYQTDDGILEHECAISAVKKLYEQKPAWSEEDNFMYNKIKNLLTDISLAPESRNGLFDWLEDIKDRVQHRPKQEWSEEDERSIRDSIFYLKSAKKYFEKDDDILWDEKWFNLCIEFLEALYKKLQPQPQWKPSDEQIVALRYVLNHLPYCTHKEEISGLLDQIKDL